MTFRTDLDNNNDGALKSFGRLLSIMEDLRARCPWDRKQTIESLRHLTIEETFELSEAILENNTGNIKEELGDLLLHIVFYARIASEKHLFTISDVIQSLCAKLTYRHPHIYDQEKIEGEKQAVKKNWEELKLEEREGKSVLSGVPRTLPSLIKAMRIQEKMSVAGFDWEKNEGIWEEIQEVMHKLIRKNTPNSWKLEDAFGEVLFTLVHYARLVGINAEDALEKANKRFTKSSQHIEQQIAEKKKQSTQSSTEELWNRSE